jgi:hypothetical protein
LWRKKKGRGKPQEKLSERGLSDEKKIKIHETCDRRKAVAARRQAFSPTRQRCPRIVQILQPQPPSLLSCLATRVAARRSEDRGRDATPRRPPPRLQAGACRRPAGRVGGWVGVVWLCRPYKLRHLRRSPEFACPGTAYSSHPTE